MSGLEIAGVVLGVLPILFAAVDRIIIPRTVMAFRKRAYIGKLARALLLQKQTIAENIKSIASLSGCDHVWLVDDDPFTYLLSKLVQEQVLEYLGDENYAALAAVLAESHDIVQKIAAGIEGLFPGSESPPENLARIITTNRDAKGKYDLRSRITLLFRGKELVTAVKDLDDATAQIDRFTRALVSNQHMAKCTPSKKALRLAKALRRIRETAGDVHVALGRGLASGCHAQHEANLLLEHRLTAAAAFFDRPKKQDKPGPPLDFHLMIVIRDAKEVPLTYEIAVQVYKEDEERQELECPVSPRLDRQTTSSTQVTLVASPTPPRAPPDVLLIENICGVLEAPTRFGVPPGACFVLTSKKQIGVSYRTASHDIRPFVNANAKHIALRELLSSTHRTPLKFRMLLALRLASNLLQLLQTRWLRGPWSKQELYFPIRPAPAGSAGKTTLDQPEAPDLDQPFISLTFGSNGGSFKDTSDKSPLVGNSNVNQFAAAAHIDTKRTLLEFGILLLELWNDSPFEARLPAVGEMGYYQRLAAAIEWLDDTADADPMPELYDRATSLCIRGVIGGDSKLADWEDMGFWAAVCADVIEPLERNCRVWQQGSG